MNLLIVTDTMILTEVGADQRRAIAEAAGPGSVVTVAGNRDEALAAAPSVEVIFGSIDPELYLRAPGLRWVQVTGSGVDGLLFPALRDGPVLLTGEKGLVGAHLADHAMALLLALTRRIGEAVRDGPAAWHHRLAYRQGMIELEGLSLGLVGFGGTGRALARRAAGFGMAVRAVDQAGMAGTAEVPVVEPLSRLDDLLGASDVVALCLPLTRETRGLFDRARLAACKPGALLINVTRGELVDGAALVEALTSGHLGGAGLDVQHREPLPADDPLWALDNVVMTPHTAGASQLRAGRSIARFIDNLGRYRRGEHLVGLVDKTLGY